MINDDLNENVEKMYNTISSNVVKYRKQKNISQLQLALDIGLSGNAFITRAEKRTNNAHFNIEHLVKISNVLDIDINNFFK
jgi:putative transcriptional regulator